MLPAELAGDINALCLGFPLASVFGLKLLQKSRKCVRRLVVSRQRVLYSGSEMSSWRASVGVKC